MQHPELYEQVTNNRLRICLRDIDIFITSSAAAGPSLRMGVRREGPGNGSTYIFRYGQLCKVYRFPAHEYHLEVGSADPCEILEEDE